MGPMMGIDPMMGIEDHITLSSEELCSIDIDPANTESSNIEKV